MPAPSALSTALTDRYTIDRLLGEGGMAKVYLARDLKHGRDVAIKVLRDDVGHSIGRDRFLREIRLAANLSHPHILPLYDSGDTAGVLWFSMPVVEGTTLRDRLTRDGRLEVADAVRLASEVADALDYAHRHDVVHRDIKPENILLHEGHAVVADFGIGKAVVAASEQAGTSTQIGVTVGTPAYMSPEQAAGESVDGRSDLFALGCVLYEMLTGDVAFDGPTVQATIARRFVHTPPSVCTFRADVPVSLAQLVDQLLAKDVADRVATGSHVVTALRIPTGTNPVATAPTQTERSVVVLPFVNQSSDAENEFFVDGLTEEIITDLSRVKALRVISSTSSMPYKGTALGLREIGAALGVRHALTGSVRKAGNALRINTQLVDVRTDEPKWAEKFSGTMDDVFDVQERVARAIAQALDVALSPLESERLRDRPISDVRAFELFVQAREALRGYDVARAMPLLERAIAIEGNVPALRALRALASVMLIRIGASPDRAKLMDDVEREARALIAESPERAWGHAVLGYVGYERGAHVMAVRALRRAMELDPADGDVRFFLGIALQAAGHPDMRLAFESAALDPLSPLANGLVGATSWFAGRAAEGLASLEVSARLAPAGPIFRWALGYHYAILGRVSEAAREAAWLLENAPALPYTAQVAALVAAMEGRASDALSLLAKVDTNMLDGHHTFHLAESYAMAGDGARALALLERSLEMGFYPYDYYRRLCPFFGSIRGTEQFARIVAEVRRRSEAFDA